MQKKNHTIRNAGIKETEKSETALSSVKTAIQN